MFMCVCACGKSRFTIVGIENNTRINSVLCTHSCKPTFAPCKRVFPSPKGIDLLGSLVVNS